MQHQWVISVSGDTLANYQQPTLETWIAGDKQLCTQKWCRPCTQVLVFLLYLNPQNKVGSRTPESLNCDTRAVIICHPLCWHCPFRSANKGGGTSPPLLIFSKEQNSEQQNRRRKWGSGNSGGTLCEFLVPLLFTEYYSLTSIHLLTGGKKMFHFPSQNNAQTQQWVRTDCSSYSYSVSSTIPWTWQPPLQSWLPVIRRWIYLRPMLFFSLSTFTDTYSDEQH